MQGGMRAESLGIGLGAEGKKKNEKNEAFRIGGRAPA